MVAITEIRSTMLPQQAPALRRPPGVAVPARATDTAPAALRVTRPREGAVPTLPTAAPESVVGTVGYYRWRATDYLRRHPGGTAPDYYLSYGEKYAQRFTRDVGPTLSPAGQAWIDRARYELQVAFERAIQANPVAFARLEADPEALRQFAFATHAPAYLRAGVADLPMSDLMKIGATPDLRDILQPGGLGQAAQVGLCTLDHRVRSGTVRFDRSLAVQSDRIARIPGSAAALASVVQSGEAAVGHVALGAVRNLVTLGTRVAGTCA